MKANGTATSESSSSRANRMAPAQPSGMPAPRRMTSRTPSLYDREWPDCGQTPDRGHRRPAAHSSKRLVRAGFAVLGENRCHFTAGWLEHFTGRQFTPDQDAAKYRDGLNLNEAFFEDAVKNALARWADNRRRYE